MLQATITTYQGYLVFERLALQNLGIPSDGSLACLARFESVVDTETQLGVSAEALALLSRVATQSLGGAPNLSWLQSADGSFELCWAGGRLHHCRAGTLLAARSSVLGPHQAIANETSKHAASLIHTHTTRRESAVCV